MEARARSAVVGRAVSPAAEWVAVRVALADSGAARGALAAVVEQAGTEATEAVQVAAEERGARTEEPGE